MNKICVQKRTNCCSGNIGRIQLMFMSLQRLSWLSVIGHSRGDRSVCNIEKSSDMDMRAKVKPLSCRVSHVHHCDVWTRYADWLAGARMARMKRLFL